MNIATVKNDAYSIALTLASPNQVIAKILAFGALRQGWHFGGGGPPTALAILNSILAASHLQREGFSDIEVFPDPDGGILVTGTGTSFSVELLCDRFGNFDVIIDNRDAIEDHGPDLTLAQVQKLISEKSCGPVKLSDSYTQSTSIFAKGGLPVSPSRTQPGREFLSSMQHVSSKADQSLVNTSNDITQQLRAIQQFSGVSGHQNFRQTAI